MCVSLQIVAFLDTGAGKTHIAVLLLRHVAPDLRTAASGAVAQYDGGCARARPPPSREHRKLRAFFMAPTVALVKQVICACHFALHG